MFGNTNENEKDTKKPYSLSENRLYGLRIL